jgi:hypothetical protein
MKLSDRTITTLISKESNTWTCKLPAATPLLVFHHYKGDLIFSRNQFNGDLLSLDSRYGNSQYNTKVAIPREMTTPHCSSLKVNIHLHTFGSKQPVRALLLCGTETDLNRWTFP